MADGTLSREESILSDEQSPASERNVDASTSTERDASPPVLDARRVSRRFGETLALDGISLKLRQGEIRALLGPNGAGKTTLLRILCGLVSPHAGVVSVSGEDPNLFGHALRHSIGFVPSGDRSFYMRISGFENLLFFARLQGLPRRRAVTVARDCLHSVGLLDVADRRVNAYSHGMQKRLSLARAMITSPPLLLIDEATHDLDPEGAQRVRALVEQRAAAGTAVLWTTQRVEEVRAFAHTVTLLNNGRIRFDGTVAQLLAHYVPSRHIVTLRDRSGLARRPSGLIDGVGRLQELGGGEYVLQLEGELNLGNAATGLAKLGWDVLACRAERPEIEEAFLRLTETEPR